MTSLFDNVDLGGPPPAVLQELVERLSRGVAPLEFNPVDRADEPGPASVVPEDEVAFSISERARQVIAMVNAAREETANAVRQECTREFEEALDAERARVEALWAEYTRDRRSYFLDVMHLTAIVRAALERVQDETVSKLRVPVSTAADWRAMFAHGETRVEVVSDERLPGGTVRLETSVGQVELGVAAQLEEVERGFEALMGGV
jgi:flagellar assembly protein FliH